jgi:hypothetical protein
MGPEEGRTDALYRKHVDRRTVWVSACDFRPGYYWIVACLFGKNCYNVATTSPPVACGSNLIVM